MYSSYVPYNCHRPLSSYLTTSVLFPFISTIDNPTTTTTILFNPQPCYSSYPPPNHSPLQPYYLHSQQPPIPPSQPPSQPPQSRISCPLTHFTSHPPPISNLFFEIIDLVLKLKDDLEKKPFNPLTSVPTSQATTSKANKSEHVEMTNTLSQSSAMEAQTTSTTFSRKTPPEIAISQPSPSSPIISDKRNLKEKGNSVLPWKPLSPPRAPLPVVASARREGRACLSKIHKDNEEPHLSMKRKTLNAGNKYEVGNMIAEVLSKVGRTGVVTLEEGKSADNNLYVVEGIQFDRFYISPYFVTDSEKMTDEFENYKLLLVDKKTNNARDLINILEDAIRNGFPILIIVEDIEQEALATH